MYNLEDALCGKLVNHGYHLYKYYKNAEDCGKIPSIMEYLQSMLDKEKELLISKCKRKTSSGIYFDKEDFRVFKQNIDIVKSFAKDVVRSNNVYYYAEFCKARTFVDKLPSPIATSYQSMYLVRLVNNKPCISSIDNVLCYGMHRSPYVLACDCDELKNDRYSFYSSGCFCGEGVYVDISGIHTDDYYFKCSRCGNYFLIENKDFKFIKNNNLPLPNRCDYCMKYKD